MAKVSDIMIQRLRAAGVAMPDTAHIERTRYKRATLSHGAWSWRVMNPETYEIIAGSSETMTELARARRWRLVDHFGEVTVCDCDTIACPVDHAAEQRLHLTGREPAMLGFALEMAEEEILARNLEIPGEDRAALDSLRRFVGEQP